MIAVSEKCILDVNMPTPIASERQYREYLSVLDKLTSKEQPNGDEEKYAEVLMTPMKRTPSAYCLGLLPSETKRPPALDRLEQPGVSGAGGIGLLAFLRRPAPHGRLAHSYA